MGGPLIIIATGADVKLVNRLLAYLKDWHSGAGYRFRILRTRDAIKDGAGEEICDQPPIRDFSTNEWERNSIMQVEELLIQNGATNGHVWLFLLLDDEGVRDGTIIIAERAVEYGEDNKFKYLKRFNKVRVPWIEAYIMWCNLDIAHASFLDFCIENDENELKNTDYWARYRHGGGARWRDQHIESAEALIDQFKQLDLA